VPKQVQYKPTVNIKTMENMGGNQNYCNGIYFIDIVHIDS